MTLGLVLVPVVLGKLWSVIPKLFDWPPFRSVAQLVERLSLVLLVGWIVFEMVIGILNIQLFYEALPFSFYTAHFYGAWVFMAAFAVQSGIRFGRMVGSLRSRGLAAELRTPTKSTDPSLRAPHNPQITEGVRLGTTTTPGTAAPAVRARLGRRPVRIGVLQRIDRTEDGRTLVVLSDGC